MPHQHLTWPEIDGGDGNDGVLMHFDRVLLYGPPGTGKTTAAHKLGEKLGLEVFSLGLTDETPAAELRGHFVPFKDWKWMHGPGVRPFFGREEDSDATFGNGGILLLDEIDKASNDTLDFLHGLLNDRAVAKITLPNGKTIYPHENFRVIATMNGELGDLPPAIQDRFLKIEVRQPHPDAVKSLPEDLQAAASAPEQYENQDRPATLRAWKQFAALRESVGVEVAAKAVFAHRAQEIMDAHRIAGMYVDPEDDEGYEENDSTTWQSCTCIDCQLQRARNKMEREYDMTDIEMDSDGEYQSPWSGTYFNTENEALLDGYDDEYELEYWRNNR